LFENVKYLVLYCLILEFEVSATLSLDIIFLDS